MINPNIKKQYPVIKMPNGHPVSATMYNRNTSQGVVYTNDEEIINTGLVVNLYATSTVVANINLAHSIRSNLSATADVTDATITKGINLESSISTSSIISANTLVSKLLESNVTSTGTLAADLTVTSVITDLLLDLYPNAAAAYSLRKLRTAYAGSAIRVRRSNDNTEQDIGFTALGVLDQSALTTFCGAGNGFVTTWYDQSGNARNATQTTAANQPQIVSNGSVILENSKPTVQFDGSNDFLNRTESASNLFATNFSFFNVHKVTDGSTRKTLIESTSIGNSVLNPSIEYNGNLPTNLRLFSGQLTNNTSLVSTNTYGNSQLLLNGLKNGTTIQQLFVNNNSEGTLSPSIIPTINITGYNIATLRIGNDRFFGGNMQEIILYNSYESTNRSAINTNINTHYAIY
jgi:hypothetical protein